MNIEWDKKPETTEQIRLAKYLESKTDTLEKLVKISTQEDLLSISFTPHTSNKDFYTYELRYNQHKKLHSVNIWKGIRAGDTLSVLYGYLHN